jgi:hypothetical protein
MHIYDPPPAEVFPPEFKFVDTPVTNADGEQIVTKTFESYKDTNLFADPKVNPVKRYFTMFLPSMFDQ